MIFNFKWHLLNRLATGSKPCFKEDAQWLVRCGFRSILSLEVLPDNVTDLWRRQGIIWCLIKLEDFKQDEEENTRLKRLKQEAYDFIDVNLALARPLYVHSFYGIKQSVCLVQKYLKENPQ